MAPGVFAAPIDTTFALYPAKAAFSIDDRALRLGRPYVVEHTPWYAIEGQLSAEEQYYREHASKTFSNWSVRGKAVEHLPLRARAALRPARPRAEHRRGRRAHSRLAQLRPRGADRRARPPAAGRRRARRRAPNDALQGLPTSRRCSPSCAASRASALLQLRMALEREGGLAAHALGPAARRAAARRLGAAGAAPDHRPRERGAAAAPAGPATLTPAVQAVVATLGRAGARRHARRHGCRCRC